MGDHEYLKGPQVKCTDCGAVIQSQHKHNMVWCYCGSIAIDGGSDYVKCSGDPEKFIWLDNEEDNDK